MSGGVIGLRDVVDGLIGPVDEIGGPDQPARVRRHGGNAQSVSARNTHSTGP